MAISTSTASSSSSSSASSTKIQTVGSKATKQKRNERERKRVDLVNQGFTLLQERVPKAAATKGKMSKVNTLREAARYIQELQKQLGYINSSMPMDFPTPEQSPVYPQSVCSMAQTPSPNYMSPYYPAPQMMVKQEMSQYYGQENSTATSSGDGFFSSGDSY